MQNVIPTAPTAPESAAPERVERVERTLAHRALSPRLDAYAHEARRLIDAALAVMQRSDTIDPRVGDIVREAGSSNQAFYRHFASKDALLLAVLADGQQRLVGYLAHRLTGPGDASRQLREWVAGVMAQARNAHAAAATRPFSVNGARLTDRFPAEMAANRELVLATLRPAIDELGGDVGVDTELVHDLVFARMNQAVIEGHAPTRDEIEHLADFCLAGIGEGRHVGT